VNTVSQSIVINATPSEVFALVTDLPGMGAFSPENTGGKWVGRHQTAALGAKFRGTNAQGEKSWSTMAKVTVFEPGVRFAFKVTGVGFAVATWSYELESVDGGTKVTETWVDDRSNFFKKISGSVSNVADRNSYTALSIQKTLAAMKAHLEQAAA
jgi:hypothetical protein